jgi:predicted nuclease of predicted toxin-antitoxin system
VDFLVDAQLPRALCTALATGDHRFAHVKDILGPAAHDAAIWAHAAATGSTIITKDDDFPRRRVASTAGPTIIWVRIGNAPNRVLIARMSEAWPLVVRQLADRTVVEIT